jgi:chemotaxis signal transduction protein
MSETHGGTARHLARLKTDFDGSFAAAPPVGPPGEQVALLLLRVCGDRAAVRLSDIQGLLPCPPVVPVPSAAPALLGVAGVRGGIVPVFSLARLCGYPGDAEPPRWMLLCGEEPLGLAFSTFEGHVRAPASAFEALGDVPPRSASVSHLVDVGGAVGPLLAIPRILHDLAGPKAARDTPEEPNR